MYDSKTGKYIGMSIWQRPTFEISDEERKKRQARFDRACYHLDAVVREEKALRAERGEPEPPVHDEPQYERVEVTPEMIEDFEKSQALLKQSRKG